jgi:hypothetical protein
VPGAVVRAVCSCLCCAYVFECFEYFNVASRVEVDQAWRTNVVDADSLTQESMVVGDYKSLLEINSEELREYILCSRYIILAVG